MTFFLNKNSAMIEAYKEQLINKLHEIADHITTSQGIKEMEIPGLLSGKTGIALFLFYYSKYTNQQKFYNIGYDFLNDVIEHLNKNLSLHTHCTGLAGIGWAFNHLASNNFIDADMNDILETIDDHLYRLMMIDLQNKNFDFLHGACGVALYFTIRLPNKKINNYLKDFVNKIEQISIKNKNGGIKWESILDQETGKRGYNISLSHGIPSIMQVLSKLYLYNIEKERVLRLIKGSVKYLYQQKLDKQKYNSTFPSWAIESTDVIGSSRLAWCYGDLGISVSLYLTAKNTKNSEWEKEALSILTRSVKRLDLIENSVADAGMCHGTAGIAHIYNRMYFCTLKPEFKNAAMYWFDQTLKMAKFKDGYAGYKIWHSEKHGGWQTGSDLLEGIAGIGLALISAISDIEPAWDECLLLS